ncbi:MAG: 3-hydroxyacyl-ACP dehydratase [Capnocytophaga sp.]|nr:3-hydroxyacyl-ACP dehydratase [Capnocytophaga sp.]
MPLLTDFYHVLKLSSTKENTYEAIIRLNADHAIFKGHFPNNPVTPGVCMMQIIKDLTEDIFQVPLFMKSSSNVKFMALINPETSPELRLELDYSGSTDSELKVKNTTSFGDTTALKLTSVYVKEN